MNLGLEGKACVVTGASRGIGLDMAKRLSEEGAHVLLVARGEEALTEAAASIAGQGGEPRRSRSTSPRRGPPSGSSPTATERFGRLDVLVNNAGQAKWRALADVPDEDWQAALGPERDRADAADARGDPGHGRSWVGPRRERLLDGRQAPLRPHARVLRRQGGRCSRSRRSSPTPTLASGVLVNAVCPGPTASEMWMEPGGLLDQSRELSGADSREEALAAAGASRPIGRLAEPAEIGAVIVFLCSEASSYVTGVAWGVDGGTVQVII